MFGLTFHRYQFWALPPFVIAVLAWLAVFLNSSISIWLVFSLYSFFRYFRLIVSIFAFINFDSRGVPSKAQFAPIDVTVICSSLWRDPVQHIETLRNIRLNNPARIILVVSKANTADVIRRCAAKGFDEIEIISLSKSRMGKRAQMLVALKLVKTDIVAFCDDDITWSQDFLKTMLACFEDPQVGAAGPVQRTIRNEHTNFVNFLAIGYLERRNFNTGATNSLDGAVSTLSGRTNIFRTSIIQSDDFYQFFDDPVNHDDDKNLTRWIYNQGHKIHLQFDSRALIRTTNEIEYIKFGKQCLRWARGHWRGNFRVMETTSYWYKTHKWSLYAIYISQFQTPALLIDGTLIYLLFYGMKDYSLDLRAYIYTLFFSWLFFTKIVKLIPHFVRFPTDILYIPAMIVFSYFHGAINLYALFTLGTTGWGNTKKEEEDDGFEDGDTSTETTPLVIGKEAAKISAVQATADA